MRYFLLAVSLSLIFSNSQAQSQVKPVIKTVNMKDLYYGVENPISISVPNYRLDEIKISCDYCYACTKVNGKYTVWPGNKDVMKFTISSLRSKEAGKYISEVQLKVKRIPDPIIRVCGKNSGDSLKLNYIQNDDGSYKPCPIIPILENFNFEVYAVVKSFTISFTNNDNTIYEETIKGNYLTKDHFDKIDKLQVGSRVDFKNIKVQIPDGRVCNLNVYYYLSK